MFRKFDLNGFLFWLSAPNRPPHVTALLQHQITPTAWSSWGRQLNLGFLTWGLHIATLGYHEEIPRLWCYVIISQILGMAGPLSLYFLARNLPRVPKHNSPQSAATSRGNTITAASADENNDSLANIPKISTSGWSFSRFAVACRHWVSKPSNWMPHQNILHIICTTNLVVISCVNEVASEETSFFLVILSRFLSFLPLALVYLLPKRWGVTHPNRDSAMLAGNALYRMIYISSLFLDSRRHIGGFILGAISGTRAALAHPRLPAAERRVLRASEKLLGPATSRTSIFLEHLRSRIPVNRRVENDILLAIDVEFAEMVLAGWLMTRASDVVSMMLLRVPRRRSKVFVALIISFGIYSPDNYVTLILRLGGSSALVFGADYYHSET